MWDNTNTMRFLWKSQLRRERGKLSLKSTPPKSKVSRKERLASARGLDPVRLSFVGTIFLWVLFFGTVGYVFFFSPLLMVLPPEVSGLENINRPLVEQFLAGELSGKYLGVIPRNSFFLVRPEKLAGQLKERYPLIRSVSVTRVFPARIRVAIQERDKIVLWCSQADCFHVLEDGEVAAVSAAYQEPANQSRTVTVRDTSGESLPVGIRIFPETFVPLVVSLKSAFASGLGIDIEDTLTVSSRFVDELRVKTSEGWEVYLNTTRPLQMTLDALALLLEKEILPADTARLQYVDVRTENRIFYAFQNEPEKTDEVPSAVQDLPDKKKEKK